MEGDRGSQLAVLVVSYNTRELLRSFLRSALAAGEELIRVNSGGAERRLVPPLRLQIIVVDNASRDGTVAMVEREFPAVLVMANRENVGPARAFNQALRLALESPENEFLVLANSDIEILPFALSRMLEFLLSHPEADGCSAALLNPDLTPQVTRTFVWRLLPRPRSAAYRSTFPGTTFAMYRRRAFQQVGGFDEVYYFYNEDLDWATRAFRAGLTFYHLTDAKVVHYGGAGRSQNQLRIKEELPRANYYYFRRHWPWLAPLVFQYNCWSLKREAGRGTPGAAEALRRLEEEHHSPSAPRIPAFTQD
ncbi:MAG: glycosyltransferase [Limnochordales bacterium]|nr:glycosyltransferase [Limnochordales bacterium]